MALLWTDCDAIGHGARLWTCGGEPLGKKSIVSNHPNVPAEEPHRSPLLEPVADSIHEAGRISLGKGGTKIQRRAQGLALVQGGE